MDDEDIFLCEDVEEKTCDICKEIFISRSTLHEHKLEHHSKKIKCSDCNFEVDNEKDLKKHQESHEEVKIEQVYRCTPCEQIFKEESIFREHMREAHAHEDKFNCHHCDFQTNCEKLLENHKKKTGHTKSGEEVTCKTCKKTFKNMEELRDHRRVEHPSTQRCNWFPKCKNGEKCLYVHIREEDMDVDTQITQERPEHKCRVCGEHFNNKHNMMKHRKQEHIQNVNRCREGDNCSRGAECWYKHENSRQALPQQEQDHRSRSVPNVNSEVDFPQALNNHKPPDHKKESQETLNKILEMLTKLVNQ